MPLKEPKAKRKTVEKLADPVDNEGESLEVDSFIKACKELLEDYSGESLSTTDVPGLPSEAKEIKIKPGFCVKTTDAEGSKVFLNICHCSEVQAPPDISEEELRTILTSDKESAYRVPMSLGTAHEETDKNAKKCLAYDIVVNSGYFEKLKNSIFFKLFFVNIASEGVEIKFSCKLNRESAIILKNKQYHGKTQKHFIRADPKPLITEMDSSHSPVESPVKAGNSNQEVVEETLLKSTTTTYFKKKDIVVASLKPPEFILRKEPPDSDQPTHIIGQFFFQGLTSGIDLKVNIGEDQILIQDTTGHYATTHFGLPILINPSNCGAQFSLEDSMLLLIMACST